MRLHFIHKKEIEEDWNIKGLVDYLNTNLLQEGDVKEEELRRLAPEEMSEPIIAKLIERYNEKREAYARRANA